MTLPSPAEVPLDNGKEGSENDSGESGESLGRHSVPDSLPHVIPVRDWAYCCSFNTQINMAEGSRVCERTEKKFPINTHFITLT